jgi:hypothetical protein
LVEKTLQVQKQIKELQQMMETISEQFDFVEYYTNTLRGRERGIKTKMRVKLAAKMLVMAWTMMKKKEEFNPDYLKQD